ncbi:MAG: stalk domain-containing protein [Bacillota bacterium]|nr:stalk domain-containing protein [Bacillota bacterium]
MKKQSNRAAYDKKKNRRAEGSFREQSPSHYEEEKRPEITSKKPSVPKAKQGQTQGTKVSSLPRNRVFAIGGIAAAVVIVVILLVAFWGGGSGAIDHAVFFINSDTAVSDGDTKALSQRLYETGGVTMAPAEDFCHIMDMKLKWDEKDGAFTVKGPKGKLTGKTDDPKVTLDGEDVTWDASAVVVDKVLYLPVASICEAMGYAVEYTDSVQRLDIYVPGDKNKAPAVDFSTDKESYTLGETVVFSIDASDKDGDDIVDYEWENRQERYDTAGEVTITLRVKDSRGAWSEQVSHTITISSSADD